MRVPPRLSTHPLIQTYRFLKRPLELLEECQRRLGDIFTLPIVGLGDWVLVSAPEPLKTLFTGPPEVLHAGEANRSVFGVILGDASVITLEEEAHLERRRHLLPPFHGDAIQGYVNMMHEITARHVDAWPVGRPFPLHRELQRITLAVILELMFGRGQGIDRGRLAALLAELANVTASPLILVPALQWNLGRYSPWGRILHVNRETDRAIHAAIAACRLHPEHVDPASLVALLLALRNAAGEPLSERAIRDELVTLLLAGHETTATALAWTFERILSLPVIHAKVLAELAQGEPGDAWDWRRIQTLDYLDAVINETHRTRPIMPFGGSRKVKAPFDIGGYTVPPGATVTNCMYLLHRRPDLYPDPERFEPARFLGRKPSPYELTPFGGGVRRCLGMAFATLEMKVILATVFSKMRLGIENPNARIVRRGFFLAPEQGPAVVAQPLSPAGSGT